jgi:hypothetical protein
MVPNFLSASHESAVTSIHVPTCTAGSSLAIYHQAGQLAFIARTNATRDGFFTFPDGGLNLRGQWYVKIVSGGGSTDDWTILFQVIA